MTILIFAYYSFTDPVFQSTVLPYFKSIKRKNKIVLFTWEQKKYKLDRNEKYNIKELLKSDNIIWYNFKWHSGRFKIVKKLMDGLIAIISSIFIIVKYKIDYIFSEGFPGAIIGYYISLVSTRKHIVHTFEPHANYMLDAGVWSKKSWEYLFLKRHEFVVAHRAYKLITATNAYKRTLVDKKIDIDKIIVLPSCVDTEFYTFNSNARLNIRNRLGIDDDKIVLCYLGKLGGMYMDEELFELFGLCYSQHPKNFFFMLFTNDKNRQIQKRFRSKGIPESVYLHKYLNKEEVPGFLSSADFGVVAVKDYPSKRFCSPIKNGEYLSCGLPLITPVGIGDDGEAVKNNNKLGIILDWNNSNLVEEIIQFNRKNLKSEIVKACKEYSSSTRDLSIGINTFNQIFTEGFKNSND